MRCDDLDKLADAILDRMTELERVDELASSILRRLQAATPPGLRHQMARSLTGFVTADSISCPTGSPPYLCTTSDYYDPCSYPTEYDTTLGKCQMYSFFADCGSSYECKDNAQNVFGCGNAKHVFRCGATAGKFTCQATKFDCDSGKLVDFLCYDSLPVFECQNTFTCEANHLFECGATNPAPFDCVGGKFNCQAGVPVTVKCCQPQGDYLRYEFPGGDPGGTDTDPGDFRCIDFHCKGNGTNVFVCAAGDDFDCGISASGVASDFDCDHFHCTDGSTTFECLADYS